MRVKNSLRQFLLLKLYFLYKVVKIYYYLRENFIK